MTTSEKLFEVLRSLLLQLPSTLAILGCIIAAAIRWKRHPTVSLTVILSLVLLIAFTLVFPFIFEFVPDWFRKPGEEFSSTRWIITTISFIYNSVWAVALAILLSAIFMQRNATGNS
jgi:hypothetical protein